MITKKEKMSEGKKLRKISAIILAALLIFSLMQFVFAENETNNEETAVIFHAPGQDEWIKYEPSNELTIAIGRDDQNPVVGIKQTGNSFIVWSLLPLSEREQNAVWESLRVQQGVGNPKNVSYLHGALNDDQVSVKIDKNTVTMKAHRVWSLIYIGYCTYEIPETEPETAPETEPETVLDDHPETLPDDIPETIPDVIPETDIETEPETTPETGSETVLDDHPETRPDDIPETIPDVIPETDIETEPETTPETEPETVLDDHPETLPDDIPETIPDVIPETDSETETDKIPETIPMGGVTSPQTDDPLGTILFALISCGAVIILASKKK